MRRLIQGSGLLMLGVMAAGCQPVPAPSQPSALQVSGGRALAQSNCAGCHAIDLYGRSTNSNAPAFASIANQGGLTAESLSTWLKGAHNYPREMDFALDAARVDKLVAYMLTLRDPNYRRPPD